MVGERRVRGEWVFRKCASDVTTSQAKSNVGRNHRDTVAPATRGFPSEHFEREAGE